MKRNEIRIRDPFVLRENGRYYLYGSTDPNTWKGPGRGFLMYESDDLEEFEPPVEVFRTYEGFWGESQFWAPEVYALRGKYYMIASFSRRGSRRGCMILVADNPKGRFVPVVNHPVTPEEWDCLDGTLYVENGVPYLVFSHEWTQVRDGEICAARLRDDMSGLVEVPRVLFRGSDGPWVRGVSKEGESGKYYVTDGPFLMEKDGRTLLLWSSFGTEGYAIGLAVSENGLFGPWKQEKEPLYQKNGGHGMVFQTKEGKRMLAIHAPNVLGQERPVFLELRDRQVDESGFQIQAPLFRDPIYDCASDPVVVWNRKEENWYLFYTQRRKGGPGVSHVYGTDIGVAICNNSRDWVYRGTLKNLDVETGRNTFWAPEILFALGEYHMFVTYITGVHTGWDNDKKILHYTSNNLWDWTYKGEVTLNSQRVIDACVYKVAPHRYKLWYMDEQRGSKIYAAISTDLSEWEALGEEIGDCPQEGPNVFELGGQKWLISDFWSGLAVYRSEDFAHWTRCRDILVEPSSRTLDQGFGRHADVVVLEERAYIFYFCHPIPGQPTAVIQAAELEVKNGELVCRRGG